MEKNANKYKILVLSDLKKPTITILRSTINLAKMVNGDIQLFYIKKPTDIIKKDNQLSANRAINQEYNVIENKILNLINPISKDYGVTINYNYSFGNVKNEIDKYITQYQPDIIVLGKRKSKVINLIGDNVTDFILKKYPGIVIITDNENSLEPNIELSIGVLNGFDTPSNSKFMDHILAQTKKPIKSFKVLKNSDFKKEANMPSDKETVEYIFEYNDNTIKNLSNYISLNNINLLCIDRGNKNTKNLMKSSIKDVIKNLNVSLLVTGEQKNVT